MMITGQLSTLETRFPVLKFNFVLKIMTLYRLIMLEVSSCSKRVFSCILNFSHSKLYSADLTSSFHLEGLYFSAQVFHSLFFASSPPRSTYLFLLQEPECVQQDLCFQSIKSSKFARPFEDSPIASLVCF